MMLFNIVALHFALVKPFRFRQVILRISLLKFCVALILFIFEYAEYSPRMPLAAGDCRNPLFVEFPGNNKAAFSHKVILENPLYQFGFRRINHQITLFVFFIPQKSRGVDSHFTLFKISSIAPLHIIADVLAFLLCKRRKDGEH